MHYIRFLKPPRIKAGPRASILTKITITTDLGESFLTADTPILVEIIPSHPNELVESRKYLWKGRMGMRELDIQLNMVSEISYGRLFTIRVRAVEEERNLGSLERILGLGRDVKPHEGGRGVKGKGRGKETVGENIEGGIVPLLSTALSVANQTPAFQGPALRTDVCCRYFTARNADGREVELRFWEDTGESIAKHIWDAGLVLSAYLAFLSSSSSTYHPTLLPSLPLLQVTLSHPSLRVLELGTGVGIVGLTLSIFYPNIEELLLTDLPDAMDILGRNIEQLSGRHVQYEEEGRLEEGRTRVRRAVWEWGTKSEGRAAGMKSSNELRGAELDREGDGKWDLIVVADCTYNPAVVPDLVQTLTSIICPNEPENPAKSDPEIDEGLQEEPKNNDSKITEQKIPDTSIHIPENHLATPSHHPSPPVHTAKTPLILLAMKFRHDSELIFFDLMADAGFVVVERCALSVPMLGGVREEIEVLVFSWLER